VSLIFHISNEQRLMMTMNVVVVIRQVLRSSSSPRRQLPQEEMRTLQPTPPQEEVEELELSFSPALMCFAWHKTRVQKHRSFVWVEIIFHSLMMINPQSHDII
jgi:hypothetical protein